MGRRGSFLFALGALVAVTLLACAAFESADPSPPGDDGGAPEASSPDAAVADAGTTSDAASDATDAADAALGCELNPIHAPCSDPRWFFRDDAGTSADGGARLVIGQTNERGQVWWTEPHVADTFDATFTVTIGPGGGDGMAFAWLNLATVPSAGGPGGNMGVCSSGNPGFGVAVDTSPSAPDATLKLLSTQTTSGCPDLPLATASVVGAGTHAIKVSLAGGTVRVRYDGAEKISHALAGYTPASAYFGFTSANGAVAAPVTVSDITIDFPKQPKCP